MEDLFTKPARPNAVKVAEFDPDLFADLGTDRERAQELAIARRLDLKTGNWAFDEADEEHHVLRQLRDERGSFGLLLLEGLLWREVCIGRDSGIELLGPGDVLRPWVRPIPSSAILAEPQWTVLQPSSAAILDRRFALAMARWPAVPARLMDRVILRSRWLTFHLAICHVRNLRQRILLAMWHFGDRWGRMSSSGVIVPVRLPHRMLAQMVGARRPSVTTALAALRAEGALVERDDGSWLLPGEAPEALRAVYEQASTSVPLGQPPET